MSSGPTATNEQRIPIFPRSVTGRYRRLKYAILALAYGVYFLLPWLPWTRNEGPAQAVLFDIVGRRFYIFDLVVYAQDIFWLAGFLAIAAFLLFFVTGIAGRVFCGYFCFQTLWTDVFMLIERRVQGERNARIKLSQAPWRANKILRYGLTWVLWALVAFLTGLTFTLYWGYAPQLLVQFFTGTAPFPAYATTLFLTLTTFVMAGVAREQVCTYMCPYARFQGVMFEPDTLIVAYDAKRGERGEGRHKAAKGLMTRADREQRDVGDCIDCGYCVQVCPTGIDIRNGMQYQCISCALCIDACDTIMDKVGFPRGLVRYASQNALEGRPTRRLKLKNLAYGLVLLAAVVALAWNIGTREPLELTVHQVRQPLAVRLSDGSVQNRYEIKLQNKTDDAMALTIDSQGLPGAQLDLGGHGQLQLTPGEHVMLQAKVRLMPSPSMPAQTPFEFIVRERDTGAILRRHPAVFSSSIP
jgi:cytochrome c oxidase accessory protein FixG